MQVDRSLHVCLLGEVGIGQSAFLQCFRNENTEGNDKTIDDKLERFVTLTELDGQQFCVRFTDTAGSSCFKSMWPSVLGTSHAVLLCFAVDRSETLQALQDKWLPLFWSSNSEAPLFVVGLRADMRAKTDATVECVPEEWGDNFAKQLGAVGYFECSVLEPESVQSSVDVILHVAKEYYSLQWQLGPRAEINALPPDDSAPDAAWLTHERLNVFDDPKVLDIATIRKSLSMLGATPSCQHAYLRIDLADLGLTSLDAIRDFKHLQFVNLSGNRLRTLEPLGALRCLLHLNASFNLIIRTQGFTAPDQLETVDMSYNMISDLGEWGVHKYLRELNLRGNFVSRIGPGLKRNAELRMLDISENHIARIENMDGLGLHTLYLAQNRLTSLEGIGNLKQLQVLNVRHNCITSIAALLPADIPRLRKLCISENRICHIKEVEGLQGFSYLCDLLLAPNPIVDLPYYREQVLHRLPLLRLLDKIPASPEEKVKSDVIYGSDVDMRRQIFEDQLCQPPPEWQAFSRETFVDRRLVTEEGIGEEEISRFQQQGCAAEFGSSSLDVQAPVDPTSSQTSFATPSRTHFQEAAFRKRLETARRGGEPLGVADFQNVNAPFMQIRVYDSDIPELLDVCFEGGIDEILLGGGAACLGTNSLRQLLKALKAGPLWHIDLSGCESLQNVLNDLLKGVPFERGCSIEASNCGIPETEVVRLRNMTQASQDARARAEQMRELTLVLSAKQSESQGALEDFALENRVQDKAPDLIRPLYHPLQWREGIESRAVASYNAFVKMNPNGVQEDSIERSFSFVGPGGANVVLSKEEYNMLDAQRRRLLKETGKPLPASFETTFAPVLESQSLVAFMVWNGAVATKDVPQEDQRQRAELERSWEESTNLMKALTSSSQAQYDAAERPSLVASAQMIAHFTYLASNRTLTPNHALKLHHAFGLKWLRSDTRPPPQSGHDLHALVASGEVIIESVVGNGFGTDSLELTLRSSTSDNLQVSVQRGTIFQQIGWEHRQNLMVAVDYVVSLPSGASLCKKMRTFSLNHSCACARDSPMSLTEFYVDDPKILESQGMVWDYFQRCFTKED